MLGGPAWAGANPDILGKDMMQQLCVLEGQAEAFSWIVAWDTKSRK
jgi:hypothetical protein